ncbi:MAG: MFS transporter, partial [Nocardioidaceae bacterium]
MMEQEPRTTKGWSERWIGLNPMGRRAFLAAGIGWGLDALDWTMYSFALPALIATLGISAAAGSYVATASLVASAFGGVIGGILADRYGRTRVLVFVILGFALFTALTATSQDLTQLFLWRILLGLAYGAEWAVGAALLAEYARPDQRGRLMGVLQSCYAIGWAVSTAFYLLSFALLPESTAWRVLFLVGIIPAIAAFYIRRRTQDNVQVRESTTKTSPLLLFRDGRARTTVLATLLGTGVQGIYYSVIIFLPLFLVSVRHISVVGTATYTWVTIVGSFVGYVVAGFLHDAVGRRPAFTTFFVGSAASICVFVTFPISGIGIGLIVTFALGFFS